MKKKVVKPMPVYSPNAWIVDSRDRGRKKIYLGNKVYLQDGSEFVIELFNPLQDSVLAELKINGKLAASTGLILRPGERFYLDCCIDDKKKFVFKTYEVDGTVSAVQTAIANNGYVEVSFYREKAKPIPIRPLYRMDYLDLSDCLYRGSGSNLNIPVSTNFTQNLSSTPTANWQYTSSSTMDYLNLELSQMKSTPISSALMETGRVEKGEQSSQQFVSVDMDFENYAITCISYQILPESRKPLTTSELKVNGKTFEQTYTKVYTAKHCGGCDVNIIENDKFCRNCGNKLK